MNWVLGIAAIGIIFYVLGKYSFAKKMEKFKLKLVENWGNPKKASYYNFFVIAKYFENNAHKSSAFHIVSDATKNDLDIDEVFKFIDRTSSKIGQQYLYFKLRTVGAIKELKRFDSLVSLVSKNKSFRLEAQVLLSQLSANESYYVEELINGEQIKKPPYIWLVKSLTVATVLILCIGSWFPLLFLLIIPILALNMVFHFRNKENVSFYLQGVGQLSKCLKVAGKLAEFKEIQTHYKEFSFLKRIGRIQLKSEFVSFEKNINNEYLFVVWFFVEVVKTIFNIEYLVFYSFIDSLKKERQSIEQLYVFIGELDAAISTASVKAGTLVTCTPVFVPQKELVVSEVYHPLIVNCVSNSVTLKNNSMLLTGSNMSGKTTFIRTIAINSLLAQTLHFCFADSFKSPFLRVYSSIRIADSVQRNTSYYLEEVVRVKELIAASEASEFNLFVLDELFKGTNTVERIAGGKAVLSFLNKKNHLVLVSTHDIELAELLLENEYELFHFSEQIEAQQLLFDHRLKKGKLTTKNAIKILELYKYPSEITKDARNTEETFFQD